MLAILFLGAVASATPATKILPIYEDPAQLQLKAKVSPVELQKSWCAGECFRHIADRPIFVVSQVGEGYDVQFSRSGLNEWAKNPVNAGLMKSLNDETKVAIVTPVTTFPIDYFPGMVDAKFNITHRGKLSDLRVPSMMFIFNEAQFKKFNEKKGYTKVADFGINQDNFSLVKEYPLV